MDMSGLKKKEFPSQTENRKQWVLDVVRGNQKTAAIILFDVAESNYPAAKATLQGMHKMDRDALLQPGGILTPEQIEALK